MMSTSDHPRLWRDLDVPGNETAALVESQRHVNRAPLCCSDGTEIVDEVKPSRWAMSASMGLIVGGIILSAALLLIAAVIACL